MRIDTIDIDGFEVGGDRTYIIAEIGSNYNQSWDLAIESIDAAIESGANAVKFQSINIDKLYWKPSDETKALHKKIDLEEAWHQKLKDYCVSKNITFFSSPTYIESINILEEIGVSLYKLASAQIGTFPQLVEKVAQIGKPTIFSTGIVNMNEIDSIVDIFEKANNPNYILLHCNSIYPTPYEKVNLGMISKLKEKYGKIIGFSDHSDGPYTAIAAVAMGAKVIEKHFAIDKKLPVPDAPFSLEPDEFKNMVEGIRIVEQTIIDLPRIEIELEENQFKQNILTRLVLNTDVVLGQRIKSSDFKFLRHNEGVDCRELEALIKQEAKYNKNIAKSSLLSKNDLT